MADSQDKNKECELSRFERNKYYYGKLMTVRDFELEQQYINGKRWLINRLLFGAGTVCGLDVAVTELNGGLTVTSGMAIDRCGREIIVPGPFQKDNLGSFLKEFGITPLASAGEITVYLYLKYDECSTEKVRAQTASTCEEVCAHNRTQENFKIIPVESEKIQEPDETLCATWSNHIIDTLDTGQVKFRRTSRRYVSTGEVIEVSLRITATQPISQKVSINDLPTSGLTLIDGKTKLESETDMGIGDFIEGMYVARVDANLGNTLNISGIPKIGEDTQPVLSSAITVKKPGEISEAILNDSINDLWTKECLNGSDDPGVILSELTIKTDAAGKVTVDTDKTKRKLVYKNNYMAQMLECLKKHTTDLEDQSATIKKKIAPNKVSLEFKDKNKLTADGMDSLEIIVTVKDDAEKELSGIKVNLYSTLGSFTDNSVTTGSSGKATATLKGGTTPGIATVIATTGIGTDFLNVTIEPATGSITGTVSDESGDPVQDATVDVGTQNTKTDSKGEYKFDKVPVGYQIVEARKTGYDDASSNVNVELNTAKTVNLTLVKIISKGTIKGKVTDSEGTPIPDATVAVGSISAVSDSSGEYTLFDVPVGTSYTVNANAAGFQSASRAPVEVRANKPTTIDFKLLAATGGISGRVTDTAGKAISDATVTVSTLSATTDPSGNYSLSNVPPGTQVVTASAAGYNTGTLSVTVVANSTIPANFKLTKEVGTITGRVTEQTVVIPQNITPGNIISPGTIIPPRPPIIKGIGGATVSVEGTTNSATTDANGYYTLADVPVGTQTVTASHPKYNAGKQTTTVVKDTPATVNFQLIPATGTITGRVTTPGISALTRIPGELVPANVRRLGETVPGRIVLPGTVIQPGPIYPVATGIGGATVSAAGISTVTDASGYYTLSNVPVGDQVVSASAAGYNTGTQPATVVKDVTINVNIQLTLATPDTGTIVGKVTIQTIQVLPQITGSSTGTTVPGRIVPPGTVISPGSVIPAVTGIGGAIISVAGTSLSTTTDAGGNYTISNVPVGTQTVSASAPGYVPATKPASVTKDTQVTVDFQLEHETGTITGKVTDQAGKPIPAATVSAGSISTITDEAGNYKLSSVPTGVQTVYASAPRYIPATKLATMSANSVIVVEFLLMPETGTITGKVTNLSGTGIEGATVAVSGTNKSATTDKTGSYTCYNVPTGTYTVIASASGYGKAEKTVTITTNPATVDFVLNYMGGTVTYVPYHVFEVMNLIVQGGLCANGIKNCETRNGISGGGYYAKVGDLVALNGKSDKLANLILEQQIADKKTLTVGESWDIGGGWTLTANSIDARATPRQAWLTLSKDGVKKDDKVVIQGSVYTYIEKIIAGETDVPVFVTYVDSIFAGATSDMLQLRYTWAIQPVIIQGTITGAITSASTGAAIGGAAVSAVDTSGTVRSTAKTDGAGSYTLSGVPPGTYIVKASASSFQENSRGSVTVSAGGTTSGINIQLTPLPGAITGKITNPANTGIPNATVSLAGTSISTITNASGDYTLSNVPPGTYTVKASASLYQDNSSSNVAVGAGQTTTINIVLTPTPGEIAGRITSTVGVDIGIPGATVSIVDRSTTTDGSGNYTLSNVPPGTYTVKVSASLYQDNSRSNVTVNAGQTTKVDMALKPVSGEITGRIIDTAGAGIQYATVSALDMTTTADSSGNYTFRNAPAGIYSVSASATGYQDGSTSVTVNAGQITTGVDIELTPLTGTITGTITSASTGTAIGGAAVSAVDASGKVIQTVNTDDAGSYTLSNVPPGTYTVKASASGYRDGSLSDVTVSAGQPTTGKDIRLVLATGTITGMVEDKYAGGISGATVSGGGKSTKTDSSGNYTLSDVPVGDQTMKASKLGYIGDSATVTVVLDGETTQDFVLERSCPRFVECPSDICRADVCLSDVTGFAITAETVPCPAGRPTIAPKMAEKPLVKPKESKKTTRGRIKQ